MSKRPFVEDVPTLTIKRRRSETPATSKKRPKRKRTRSVPVTHRFSSKASSTRDSLLDSNAVTPQVPQEMSQTTQDANLSQDITTETNSLREEISALKREIEAKNKVIESKESSLSQLQQGLTCPICLEFLHRPYAVAPCGHVSCYDCMRQWFTTNLNEDVPAPASLVPRTKTCPHCRSRLTHRPVEAWPIKNMVSSLVTSGVVPAPALPNSAPPNASLDPWHGIFPPVSDRFRLFDNGNRGHFGLFDEEDDVYRCTHCHHEIFNGRCTGCDAVYDEFDEEDYDDEDEEDDYDSELETLGFLAPALLPLWALHEADEDFLGDEALHDDGIDLCSESECPSTDGKSEDEGESFTDQSSPSSDDDVEIVAAPTRRTGPRPVVLSDDDETSSEDEF